MGLFKIFFNQDPEKFEQKGDAFLKAFDWGRAKLEFEKALNVWEKKPSDDALETRLREAIEEYWRYYLNMGNWEKESVIEDLYGYGDTAIQTGHSINYFNGERVSRSRFMVLYKVEDGEWKIHRVLSNVDP